jgi:hypothetical protein
VDEANDRMRGRTIVLRVLCASAPERCRGTATLHLRGLAGRARIDVAPGRSALLPVKLTRRAARLARHLVRIDGGATIGLRYSVIGARPTPRTSFIVDRVS